jgi:hypothetical protein
MPACSRSRPSGSARADHSTYDCLPPFAQRSSTDLAGRVLLETAPELVGKLVSPSHLAPELLAGRPLPAARRDLAHDEVFAGIAAFLRALARHAPLVMVVDNAQCIDAVSVDLLGYLARALREEPVFFVGLYRPGEILPRDGGRHRLEQVMHACNPNAHPAARSVR